MNEQQTGQVLQQIETLERDVIEIKKRLDEDYVTKDSFNPISRIMYALVSLILLGFFGTLSALIYNNHNVKP